MATNHIISIGDKARSKILAGVRKNYLAVGSTLGPKGRNVAIDSEWTNIRVVHDGVSVSKAIILNDPIENMGNKLISEAASRTNDAAGDGTTLATVLTYAMAKEAHKLLAAGANAMLLRRGMEKEVEAMVSFVNEESVPVVNDDEVEKIAKLSAQNEIIGDMISGAIRKLGRDALITVGDGSAETTVEYKEGMEFSQGFTSPMFMTNQERGEASIDNPYILVTDAKISDNTQFIPLLKLFAEMPKDGANLVIIADEVSGLPLNTLVMNKMQGNLNVVVIKAPEFGDRRDDMLEDIAIVTGATVVTAKAGLSVEEMSPEYFGRAARVVSTKENTMIVDGRGVPGDIRKRIKTLRALKDKAESQYDAERLEERLAKLTGGVAVINLSANSDAEMAELRERAIDAIHATKSALAAGTVPGGETTLRFGSLKSTTKYEDQDEKAGADIVRRAVSQPFNKLMRNSGYDPGEKWAGIRAKGLGWGVDVMDGELKDLRKSGIIDPAMVLTSALRNALSAAVMIITTDTAISKQDIKSNATT